MSKIVIVGSAQYADHWCRERGISPHSRDVIRVFEPLDTRKLSGFRWDDLQVVQLAPPHPVITRYLAQLAQQGSQRPGVFVAFEGGEGAGKSTQVRILADLLRRAGRDVVVTREPGGTRLGETVRSVLLLDEDRGDHPTARAEALLFAADRAQNVETVIRPALGRGAVVLSDRYVDSSLAYQGAGRALDEEQVREISAFATGGLMPDLTVLLDIPTAEGLARVLARRGGNRLDAEAIGFHRRVRERFLALAAAEPHRFVVVDAQLPEGEVAVAVAAAVDDLVKVDEDAGV